MTAFKTSLTFIALIVVIGMFLLLIGGCAERPIDDLSPIRLSTAYRWICQLHASLGTPLR
jgi:hypothetical protein